MKLIISDGERDEEQIEFNVLPETFDRVFDILTKGESLDRVAEQRDAPVHAEQETACAWDNVASPDFDGCNGCRYACALGLFPNRSAGG